MQAFFESVGGRKLAVVVLAMIATVTVGLALKIDGVKILDVIVYLTGIGAGSIALEDGLKALGGGKTTETKPQS